MLRPCPSSLVFIRGCHPWMASTDGRFVHGWHFSIYGWHPRMTLPHPWMTSKDGTFIHAWGFSIHGWNLHPSDFWWKLYASYFTNENSFPIGKYDACNFHQRSDGWRFHPLMEKPHPWMKVPSLDVIHGWRNVIHGWKIIRGCHPWMEVTDDGHGQSKSAWV